MRTKHWIYMFLLVVGVLFVYHTYQTKGGVSGFKSGLGIGA